MVSEIRGNTPASDGSIYTRDNVLMNGMDSILKRRGMQKILESGRVVLVPADSPHRCVLEYAEKLRGQKERVPLTLASHPEWAIVKGPKRGPHGHCGYDIFHEQLGMGPKAEAAEALWDGTFLRMAEEDSLRVMDVEKWKIHE